MVKKIKNLYLCEVCKLHYKDISWAEKCESWCKEHPNSCNLEAIKHALEAKQKSY